MIGAHTEQEKYVTSSNRAVLQLRRLATAAWMAVAVTVFAACGSPIVATDAPTGATVAATPQQLSGTASGAAEATCVSVGQLAQPSSSGGAFTVGVGASCFWSLTSDQPW